MMLLPTPFLLLLVSSLNPVSGGPGAQYPLKHHELPSNTAAQNNAPRILNTLHSSLRQFPASIHHNGMSFFPASIPANTLLYHGTHSQDQVEGMEWLAFEIEHAEVFAKPRRRIIPPGKVRLPFMGSEGSKRREDVGEDWGEDLKRKREDERVEEGAQHGYLHIYQTRHALTNLLYIDGMSAAKCPIGTLDSTDMILLGESLSSSVYRSPRSSKSHLEQDREEPEPPKEPWRPNSDYGRAQDLCDLGKEWGVEGFIRMEAGFELILCNFTAHLNLVSANQRPDDPNSQSRRGLPDKGLGGWVGLTGFEYLRALEQRYHGITDGRIVVDYSNMVSAYFSPHLNLTNPDFTRGDVPRLPSNDPSTLAAIKKDLGAIFLSREEKGDQDQSQDQKSIDWQGIADMIISRYTSRLPYLAANFTSSAVMIEDIGVLLDAFIDYATVDLDQSRANCSVQYLRPVTPTTKSDTLIHSALLTVTSTICDTLFEVRETLLQASSFSPWSSSASSSATSEAKTKITELMQYLNWATWKECGKCNIDEVCFLAIWPWGRIEDHEKPSCVASDGVSRERRGYWNPES